MQAIANDWASLRERRPDLRIRDAAGQPAAELKPDDAVDVAAFESDWRGMRNTHDFHGLLRRHDVARTQALRLVPDELARPATNGALRQVLVRASADGLPLMVFVNSPGTIQIHHGPVVRLKETTGWLNVLDPGFQLHARADEVGSTWEEVRPRIRRGARWRRASRDSAGR